MDSDRTTKFIHLLTSHQPRVYAYIATALFGDSAASDVLQETNLHLWADAEQYDFDRPFLPWALAYARNRVLAYRKTCNRSRLIFGDDALDYLNAHCLKWAETADDRLPALQKCLKKLNDTQADLIHERYVAKTPVHAIAERNDVTPQNISSRLHRIRKALASCIERALKAEGT